MIAAVPDTLMEEIQQLQDTFGAAADQAIVLTDKDGCIITSPATPGTLFKEMLDSLQDTSCGCERLLHRLGDSQDPAVMEWVPGLKYAVTPLAAGYGRVYYLWSGLYMEQGTKEQVLAVFEARMQKHPAYGRLISTLRAMPEISGERITEIGKSISVLARIICKLLAGWVLKPQKERNGRPFSGVLEQLGMEGVLRLKEAAEDLQRAGSLQELGKQLLDVVTGLPFPLSSVLVLFQNGDHAAHTYYARGWTPESGDYYVRDLESRYSPQSFLSSAIIHEAAGGLILLECPLLAGNEFRGVLSVGFRQRREAEQWIIQLETVAGLAGWAIRLIEKDSRYWKQSEVFLASFREYLQNNNIPLQYLSLDASELARDFARYLERPEAEAELVSRACLLAPFRSDLLGEYGFFAKELELLKQVDRLRLPECSQERTVLPLAVQLLALVLHHMSGQADRKHPAGPPLKWIDYSRFSPEPSMTTAVEDEPRSSFERFLQSRAYSRPKKRAVTGSRLLDSAALTLPKEEWGISPREEEVLELIVHGKTNKEIAGALFISEHTVKNHLSRIFNKMNVTDRSQIIALIYKRILNSERIEI
ncbi:response regulator transcription factor [Paenibacillus sp. FSL R7-0331]|uniref:response regulator transcription factor n=1 Tax=Paenibacillus sp. FSL R7-0331 TaxID=1536773 RepID=UPI000694D15F|nr:helix-turn-helix transcriptional regulator [Paenibacillus sp. FSL R7-0331]